MTVARHFMVGYKADEAAHSLCNILALPAVLYSSLLPSEHG